MHLQSVRLQNFRRFERFECAFDPHFTLLIGTNGTGKTSLLRAIWFSLFDIGAAAGNFWPQLSSDDVYRTTSVDASDESWRLPHYPCKLESTVDAPWMPASLIPVPFEVGLDATGQKKQNPVDAMVRTQKLKDQWFDATNSDPIPLFVNFNVAPPNGMDAPKQIGKPFERKQDILAMISQGGVNAHSLMQWFQYNELRQLQEGKAPLIYEEVRGAVLEAIHAEDIRYVVRDNSLMVRHAGVGWRPFSQLSDGQLRIASIFCDLAIRCASLNSHLGAGSIAKTPGLVTVDELDLHLHPKWQQQVVGDLRRVFPLLQFIVTSHSPFLLQAAFEHGAVVDMVTGRFVEPSDLSIEDIAEGTMGVVLPQRGKRFQAMKAAAQSYYELLEKVPNATPEKKAQIKQQLDDALIPYANDPAYAAFLEMHRAAAGV